MGLVGRWRRRARVEVTGGGCRYGAIEERFLHCASRRVRSEANAGKRRRLAAVGMTVFWLVVEGHGEKTDCAGFLRPGKLGRSVLRPYMRWVGGRGVGHTG